MKRGLLIGIVVLVAVAEVVYLVRNGWFDQLRTPDPSRVLDLSRTESAAAERPAELGAQLEVPSIQRPAQTETVDVPTDAPRTEAPVAAPEWVRSILDSPPERWSEKKNDLTLDERVALKNKISD